MAVPVNKNIPSSSLPSCYLSLCFFFSPVHFLVFEKWPEGSSNHGAPLHHQQISGGARHNVQPGIQESLLVQTSSTATKEGKKSADRCRLSLTEQHSFFPSFFLSVLITVVPQPDFGLGHTTLETCCATQCRSFTLDTFAYISFI